MFDIEDVWWEIAQHLPLSGIKNLRFTSRYFHFLQPALDRARLVWTYATEQKTARVCAVHGNVGGIQGDIFDFAGAFQGVESGFWSRLFRDPRCSYTIRVYGMENIFIYFPYPLVTCNSYLSCRQMPRNAHRLQALCGNGKLSIESYFDSISHRHIVRIGITVVPSVRFAQMKHVLQDWFFSFGPNKHLRNVVFHNAPFYVPQWKFNIPTILQHPIVSPVQSNSGQIWVFDDDNQYVVWSAFRLSGKWTMDERTYECSAELIEQCPDDWEQSPTQDENQHRLTASYRVYFNPYYRQFLVRGRLGPSKPMVQFVTLPPDVAVDTPTILDQLPRHDISTSSIGVDIFMVGH